MTRDAQALHIVTCLHGDIIDEEFKPSAAKTSAPYECSCGERFQDKEEAEIHLIEQR